MPLYTYRCSEGCYFERFLSVKHYQVPQLCELHQAVGERIIAAPLMVTAQVECRYDSPIDGTIITSWAARRNDLAKHHCQPYDPEMKTDHLNRLKDQEQAIDRAVDDTVERAWARMPKAKQQQLQKELVNMGADLTYTRSTKS